MGYAVRFLSGDVRPLSGAMVLAASALCNITSATAQNATTTESLPGDTPGNEVMRVR